MLTRKTSPSAGISNWLCLFDHKPVGPNPYLPGCPSVAGTSFATHFPDAGDGTGDITSLVYGAAITSRGVRRRGLQRSANCRECTRSR